LADAFRIPYASHGGSAAHLSVLACLPNTIYLESGLIEKGSGLILRDGYVELPQGPGFDWE
jgi:L-alanine-DL-glutamate epimerase-like enolase superfamily enzyme